MNSDNLIGTYTRYKRGTQKVITWLSDSAARASNQGTSKSSLHKRTSRTKSTRLHTDKTPAKIPVHRLPGLARDIITATDPRIEIPLEILDITKDVLNGRRLCAEWYTAYATNDKSLEESNKTHRHFLNTLEEVFELLRAGTKSRRPKRKKKIELATDVNGLNNLYRHLDLAEPASGDETEPAYGAATAKKTTNFSRHSTSSKHEVQFEEDPEEEKRFVIWAHMQDLFELRLEVRRTWEQYTTGDISFFTATQVTNTAMQVAVEMDNDLRINHPDLKTFSDFIKVLGEADYVRAARHHSLRRFGTAPLHGDAHRDSMEHRFHFLGMNGWTTLIDCRQLANMISKGDHIEGDKVLSAIWPCHAFAQRLLGITGDLVHAMGSKKADPKHRSDWSDAVLLFDVYGDHYTQRFTKYLDEGKLTSSLVVATQMYMDICDILDGDLARGVREASPYLDTLVEKCDDFQEWFDRLDDLGLAHCGRKYVFHYHQNRSMVLKDLFHGGREGWVLSAPQIPDGPHRFIPMNVLSTLPLLAATAVRTLLYINQIFTMTLSSRCQVVLATAYLQQAAQVSGLMQHTWPDLDHIVARENAHHQFLREGDGTVRGVAKQYCLGLGMSINQIANKHRPPIPSMQQAKKKAVTVCHYSHFMAENDLEDVYRDEAHNAMLMVAPLDTQTFYSCIRRYARKAGIANQAIAEQWQQTKKLTPGQSVQVLKEIFTADEPFLHFDYARLYRRCLDALMAVHEVYSEHAKSSKIVYGCLHEMVYELLWDAAGAETRGLLSSQSVMQAVANIFDDTATRYGNLALAEALQFCSGSIPDHLKPSNLYSAEAVAIRQTCTDLVPIETNSIVTSMARATSGTMVDLTTSDGRQIAEEAILDFFEGSRVANMENDAEQMELEALIVDKIKQEFGSWTAAGEEKHIAVARARERLSDELAAALLSSRADVRQAPSGDVSIAARPLTEEEKASVRSIWDSPNFLMKGFKKSRPNSVYIWAQEGYT